MKLTTKLLTAISSIAIVGTVVPTTVSCGCSKKEYLFNYGDQVNCRDKKDDNYHKIKEVQTAAKKRAAKAQRGNITSSQLLEINNLWPTEIKLFFYDLVASAVITNNEEINFKNWKFENSTLTFTWNGQDLQGPRLQYDHAEDGTIWLYLNNDFKYRSYTYYDCQYK